MMNDKILDIQCYTVLYCRCFLGQYFSSVTGDKFYSSYKMKWEMKFYHSVMFIMIIRYFLLKGKTFKQSHSFYDFHNVKDYQCKM